MTDTSYEIFLIQPLGVIRCFLMGMASVRDLHDPSFQRISHHLVGVGRYHIKITEVLVYKAFGFWAGRCGGGAPTDDFRRRILKRQSDGGVGLDTACSASYLERLRVMAGI